MIQRETIMTNIAEYFIRLGIVKREERAQQ